LHKWNWAPLHEEQCDFTIATDVSDITVPSACGKKKKLRNRVIKLKDEQLDLQ
jgi:hypothetical protein